MPRIQAATSLTILSRLTPTQNLLDEISSSLAIMLCYRCEAHQAIVVKCDRNRLDWQRLRWPIKPAVCSAKELTSSPPESAGRPALFDAVEDIPGWKTTGRAEFTFSG